MANPWYPGAVKRPIPEATTQSVIVPRLAIVHTNGACGHTASLYNYWARSDVGTESHFQVARSGVIEQYMPVNVRADCNYKANSFVVNGVTYGAVSFETEDLGWPCESNNWEAPGGATPLTPEQFEAIARCLAWLNLEWALSLANPTAWNGEGVGYHVQFPYPYWTNSPGKQCPGGTKIAQMPALRSRAVELVTPEPPPPPPPPSPTTVEFDMAVKHPLVQRTNHHAVWVSNGLFKVWIPSWNGIRQKGSELGLLTDDQAWNTSSPSYLPDGEALRAACVTSVGYLDGYGPTLPGTPDWPGAYQNPPDNTANSVIA